MKWSVFVDFVTSPSTSNCPASHGFLSPSILRGNGNDSLLAAGKDLDGRSGASLMLQRVMRVPQFNCTAISEDDRDCGFHDLRPFSGLGVL